MAILHGIPRTPALRSYDGPFPDGEVRDGLHGPVTMPRFGPLPRWSWFLLLELRDMYAAETPVTLEELAAWVRVTPRTMQKYIKGLLDAGYLRPLDATGPWPCEAQPGGA